MASESSFSFLEETKQLLSHAFKTFQEQVNKSKFIAYTCCALKATSIWKRHTVFKSNTECYLSVPWQSEKQPACFFFFSLCKLQHLLNKPCQPVCEDEAVNGWRKPASNNSFPLINSVCILRYVAIGSLVICSKPVLFLKPISKWQYTSNLSLQWSSGQATLCKHSSWKPGFLTTAMW